MGERDNAQHAHQRLKCFQVQVKQHNTSMAGPGKHSGEEGGERRGPNSTNPVTSSKVYHDMRREQVYAHSHTRTLARTSASPLCSHTTPHHTPTPHTTPAPHTNTAQYSTAQHSTAQHSTTPHHCHHTTPNHTPTQHTTTPSSKHAVRVRAHAGGTQTYNSAPRGSCRASGSTMALTTLPPGDSLTEVTLVSRR